MQGFVITWPALSMESKHAMHTNTVAPIRLRLPPLTAHGSRAQARRRSMRSH